MGERLLTVEDLVIQFNTEDGIVRAVNGVSFAIDRGDVFAVVGESGSGKTVTAMSILGLLPMPPAEIVNGKILWGDEDLLKVDTERRREVRGGEISMIFQDPLTALNPVHTVGRQIGEVVQVHRGYTGKQAKKHAIEMLGLVGIPNPAARVDMHPHEFSGGMRQRVMIAWPSRATPRCSSPTNPRPHSTSPCRRRSSRCSSRSRTRSTRRSCSSPTTSGSSPASPTTSW